jgi:hypothetical protein
MDDAVLARIEAYWARHGQADAWTFITTNLHNGDLYSVLTLLRPFRMLRSGGRPVRVLATGRTHHQIALLFRDVIDEVIYTPEAAFTARDINHWRVIRGCGYLTTGTPIPLNVIDYIEPPLPWGGLWFLFNDLGIFYMHLFKFLLGLPLDVAPSPPTISPHARHAAAELLNQYSLPFGKTVVLFPYAQTAEYAQHPQRVRDHFAALAERARLNGLSVCTSVVQDEEPVDGTRSMFIPFGLLIPFCDLAGYAVTIRSGITDMLSVSQCRKLHIYPSQRAADRVSPVGLGLGGIEQNLAFQFAEQPDPDGFAKIASHALLAPQPTDGSAWVPALVRDLLALKVSKGAPDGRFRAADGILRMENYRLFVSGVLAEGWSGAEDWGTWTLGHRSIVYLRAATAFGLDPAETDGCPIVLLLDLQFAITRDIHEVLEYSVEVNGRAAYYQARWPDRWRVLRLPLAPAELHAPVRVIFSVENPALRHVPPDGGAGDRRVIGIGLLKATYELAQNGDA